jgi:hypothetical protein
LRLYWNIYGEERLKLEKTGENWRKLEKTGENLRKLEKTGERKMEDIKMEFLICNNQLTFVH